jgi:hypothetical protein
MKNTVFLFALLSFAEHRSNIFPETSDTFNYTASQRSRRHDDAILTAVTMTMFQDMTQVTPVMLTDVSEKSTSGSTSKRKKEPVRSRRQTGRRIWCLVLCLAFDPVTSKWRLTSTGLYGVTRQYFSQSALPETYVSIFHLNSRLLYVSVSRSHDLIGFHIRILHAPLVSPSPFNLLQWHWFKYRKSIRGNLRLWTWWRFGMWAFFYCGTVQSGR